MTMLGGEMSDANITQAFYYQESVFSFFTGYMRTLLE